MKKASPPITLLCIIMSSSSILAQTSPAAPTVEVFRIETKPPARSTEYNAFAGQTARFDLILNAPKDGPGGRVLIHADIFQAGGPLLIPLQKDLTVTEQISITGANPPPQVIAWDMPVPDIPKEARVVVRFRIKTGDLNWQPAGEFTVNISSKQELKTQLSAIAKERPFHLFGPGKALRDFLNSREIPFTDEGDTLANLPSKPEPNTLYLGTANSKQLAQWLADATDWHGNLIVFCDDSGLLPGVYVASSDKLRLSKVTLPLIQTLDTNPQSQKTLLEILNASSTGAR